MGKYLQIKDEQGDAFLLQQSDPLWDAMQPLRDAHYEMWQIILPNELACHLSVNRPNHNKVDAFIESGDYTLEHIGRMLLVEDIRKILYPTLGVREN